MRRTDPLFTPTRIGHIDLANRVVMAPMTRNRAGADGVPTPIMATYYAQRASAGLIVAEMTYPSPQGKAYINTPGIHNGRQVDGWRAVTEAVHERGGRIVLQIGHGGRISHPLLQPAGALPVAPSAIQPEGSVFTTRGPQPFVAPRALATSELPGIVAEFAVAAALAKDAGFDGIELHAANGYLLDQFLRDGSNRRTDAYGGSAANRARLLREVVDATVKVWGEGRVGVRLSPLNPFNSMSDSNVVETFTTAARAVANRGLAYLHVIEPVSGATERMTPLLRQAFGGAVMLNGSYSGELAADALAHDEGEVVAFGSPFIANPDLVQRIAIGASLAAPDSSKMYVGGAAGYIDYPPLTAAA